MAPSNFDIVAAAVRKTRKVMRSTYDKHNGPVLSLAPRQQASRKDRGPSSTVRICPVTIASPPENDIRDAVKKAVHNLADTRTQVPCLPLDYAPVSAEWVSIKRTKAAVVDDEPQSLYDAVNSDVENKTTIIYIHGGNHCRNGLGTSRPTAAKLSAESGARVIVLDYRLGPQYAFPNQILDLFHLYLSLLAPPPGSLHHAVPANSIVVAGESSGGTIVLGFVQALLQVRAQPITFHGQRWESVPMPAGFANLGPQAEMALCLPSWERNRDFDIFSQSAAPYLEADFPADEIWPSKPPREDIYCGAPLFAHPMVSPCTANSWRGCSPMWFGIGQERLEDAAKIVAQTAARDDVCVWWDQYEAMPHAWPFYVPKMPHSAHVFARWGRACRDMGERKNLQNEGIWFEVESLNQSIMDVTNLTPLAPADAKTMIEAKARQTKIFYGSPRKAQL